MREELALCPLLCRRDMPTETTSLLTAPQQLRRLQKGRRKFLSYFPAGFRDADYVDSERSYKWQAHLQWREALGEDTLRSLVQNRRFEDVAERAIRIEGRTNLLFSFEKMALRDGARGVGAPIFATALLAFLHGPGTVTERFDLWCSALSSLPRKQTRVLTWPAATVFGFIAQPKAHLFIKPNVMRRATHSLGLSFSYVSRPNGSTYVEVLSLAASLRKELKDLGPRDMIDVQSFLWVQGSDEYPD
jgi:hypothetical protein